MILTVLCILFKFQVTLQLALAYLCEHSFHLTRLNADMIYLHQESGLTNISYFKFDFNDEKGELNSNRPVPFRLTPNIVEFLSKNSIAGPLSATIVATARCLVLPNYKLSSILKAILRDEIIALHKKRLRDVNAQDVGDANAQENTITSVIKAVSVIMSRLNSISYFDNRESKKVSTLIEDATKPDNLCRMDPAWHPWL